MHWRHLPNSISAARLLSVPILVWMAHKGADQAFIWVLLAAGSSDLLDGWLARRYGWTSPAGALLDSSADIALVLTALYGIWVFHPDIYVQHWPLLAAVAAVWLIVHVAALIRYGRLASFHTRLTQIGMALFGVFVVVLFFDGFLPWLFYLSGTICFLGGIETLIMVYLIPRWTPDLRGGLFALLRRREQGIN